MVNEITGSGKLLLFHTSFGCIREFGGYSSPFDFISSLCSVKSHDTTLVMPSFSYNFINRFKETFPFDTDSTHSLTGALTEEFRKYPGVVRTSSPSHSFLFLGDGTGLTQSNNPVSPLGKGSMCEVIQSNASARIVMIGCGFESLTHLHYLENREQLPYIHINPWEYMGALPMSLSNSGVYPVIEFPGCAKGFREFENYLLAVGELKSLSTRFKFYILDPQWLREKFIAFIDRNPFGLLCKSGCKTCDSRLILQK